MPWLFALRFRALRAPLRFDILLMVFADKALPAACRHRLAIARLAFRLHYRFPFAMVADFRQLLYVTLRLLLPDAFTKADFFMIRRCCC